jgi:hypothetical protein
VLGDPNIYKKSSTYNQKNVIQCGHCKHPEQTTDLVLLPRRVAVLYPEPPAVLLAVVFRLLQLEKNTFVVSGVLYRKLSH